MIKKTMKEKKKKRLNYIAKAYHSTLVWMICTLFYSSDLCICWIKKRTQITINRMEITSVLICIFN